MIPNAERAVGARQARATTIRASRASGRWLRATAHGRAAAALEHLPRRHELRRAARAAAGRDRGARQTGATRRSRTCPASRRGAAVPPGLTGVAQIYAPRDIPRRQKFRYDRLYIRRQSFGARRPTDNAVVLDYLPRHLGSPGHGSSDGARGQAHVRDVVVIGAGPAGSITARTPRRARATTSSCSRSTTPSARRCTARAFSASTRSTSSICRAT